MTAEDPPTAGVQHAPGSDEMPVETAASADAGTNSQEQVQRAMRKMAEKAPQTLVEMTAMMGSMGPLGHPLHQKMNEKHITKMLDLAVQHDTNEFELRKKQQDIDSSHESETRRLHVVYFGVFIALVVVILCMFRNQPAVLVPILTGVGGVVTGFVGGFGYGRSSVVKKAKPE